ncbi:hypothetical protein AU194_16200 [Mycobacterium sp. GA-2829]|nr:hypothetical protein AU194_16200 [Mycobacterium sp. GA-2829]
MVGVLVAGMSGSDKLNVTAAQDGVTQILTDKVNGYGFTDVGDVTCNDGQDPEVKQGATFNCDVTIFGATRQVTATFTDDKGTYEVGAPDLVVER